MDAQTTFLFKKNFDIQVAMVNALDKRCLDMVSIYQLQCLGFLRFNICF